MPNPQNRVGKHPNNLLKFSGVALNAKFFVYTAMVSMQVLGSIFGFGSVSITGMFTIPAAQAAEGISHTINYQGKLMDSTGNLVADGNYNMAFVIYDAASVGNQLWSASTTNGLPTGTTSTISVTVTSGLFSVLLGDVSNGQVAFPDSLFNNDSLYLGVTIGADSEMLPRKRLSSVPYSYNSEMLQGQYASSTVAATGGDLFALHQGSADSASSARTALYIETKGTSNLNDFLIRASNSASDVFTINREGNVTTTGNLVVDGSTKLNSTLAVSATSSLADLSLTGRVNSNLLPYLTDTYNLGNSTYRWLGVTAQNINAVNVSSTNIDALGYVSTTNLYSSTALLGNATTTNLYNSGTVSTTALYVNGVAITGAGATPTWQQVTDVGATTNKWIQFAGSTSTGNIVPNLTNSLTLGTTNYKWLNVFATNGTFTNVSSTNIDASGYISANTLISNSANLGNVTTTNLYNSGVVSTTQLYVNGVVVTGAGPTATLQQVTDAGATTNKWLQFAGATSTNHFLPGTNNLYNLGSAAYRWANLFAVNGSLTNVTTTNLFASGYVSTTNLYVNGTQITGATPTLQQVTDAGYITNDAIGFAGASSTGHLLPTANITYDLGSATFRWRNLYASNGIFTNVSSTNIDALGYVSTTNLYSSTALLGNVTSTNLYNSGVVSTTQLYVNGVAVTGAGPTATLQQVTDAGATTNKWLQFAGATSTNNIVPSITNSLTLGVPNYKWLSIFAQNADFTNVSTTNLDASGYIVTNNLTATTADLTFVSSTNIDASGYVSADTLISNSANLGNATTTNLYNSGTVSTTQLYVNGVAVTGVESQTLQNVTDLGATTNHWLQFAGATSTNHFLPGTNNLYNLGSASYRWANIYGVNGVFSNVSSTNIDALGYVSTTNLFVNNTQVTPDQYFLQNGNSFGATAVLGTNDFNQLNFETNDSVRMSITSLGMIGIASSTPTARLTVVGDKNLPALNIRNFSDTSSFFFINKNGVIGMNTSTLSSGFQVNINGDIGPSVNLAYNIGASDYAWNNIWGKVLHSKYLLHMDSGSYVYGNLIPTSTLTYYLGNDTYKWLGISVGNVSTTNIDALGYVSTTNLFSNTANLGNVTTTNLYNSGVVSTTQLYVNGVAVTGAGPTPTWQQVTDAGATTNHWLQFAGATSTNHFLPGTNNLYNLGSTSYRWANLFAVNGNLTNATTTNLFASGYVSTTNLYVNGTQITGATPTLQQVTDAGYITNDAIGFAGASSTGHLLPTANITYDLGSATFRWRNLYASNGIFTNVSSTNIDALGYVSTTNLYSSTALLGNVTSTNLYNSGVVSTTQLYVNGVAVTGAGPTATLQQVTDAGATTNHWLQFAGATSTNNIVPNITNSLTLGVPNYKWLSIFAQNADFTNVSTTNLDASGYIVTNNLTATTADLTFVSSTNIDASGYVSADTLISNTANLGNATTTNLYNSGTVSTTQLYVNGVAVTGIESQTLQNVTDLGSTTNHWLQFAGATSTNHFLPGTNNLYNLGSLAYRWANLFAINGNFTGTVTTTNLFASGYVSTTNLYVNGTQITGAIPTLQQVTDAGYITNDAIGFAGASSTGNVLPTTNLAYDLGSSSNRWKDVWASSTRIGTSTWEIWQSNQGLTFSENFIRKLTIAHSGNVGIGVTNPGESLHLSGAIRLGTTSNNTTGNVRWDGGDFTGFDGTSWKSLTGLSDVRGEATGFPNRTDTIISFTTSTRTFSIAPTGASFDFYYRGSKYTKNTAQTVQITDTEGSWTFYFDGAGVLQAAQSFPGHKNAVIVANVYWDATNKSKVVVGEERHGLTMDGDTHTYLHKTVGTRYNSGLSLTASLTGTGNSNVDAETAITGGIIFDEDIQHTIVHSATPTNIFEQNLGTTGAGVVTSPAKLPVYYRSGASGYWRKIAATAFPVYGNGTSTTISYNNPAGPWTVPPATSGYFVAAWIMATNNINEPVIAIVGQRQDNTIATARSNNTYDTLSFGSLPFEETKVLYRVIFETKNSFNNGVASRIVDIQDLRSVSNLPGGTYVASAHGALSGLSNDDHTQYFLLSGRTGGQAAYGGINASENLIIDSTSNVTKGKVYLAPTGGNVLIGTNSTQSLFSLQVAGNVGPSSTASYDLGSSSYRWRDIFSSRNVYASGTVQGATMRSYGTLRADGAATFNGTVTLGDATADTITTTGYFGSNLIPSVNTTYTLGTSALRWKNLYATNVSSTYIDALGYVSTTKLYINGSLFAAGTTPSFANVTLVGATSSKWISFYGASSTGDLRPSATLTYNLGTSSYRWKDVWASSTRIGTSTWDIWQSNTGLTFSKNNLTSKYLTITNSGILLSAANNTQDIGSSANRWKNTYVADVNSLPTGSTLSIVTSTATGGNGAHDIKIIGKYAYVANYTANNFSILDISNPTYTSTLGTVTLGTNPYALDIQGNYAYVVNRNSDTISVVDITNVNAPVVVATMQNGSGGAPANTFNDPEDVLANGNYLYIANWNNYKLVVMDISNPASPTYINGFTVLASYPPVSLAMRGNQLYVGLQGAISGGYFGILDISNPANPSNLKSVNIGGKPKGLDIQGNYAYVTENDTNQLSVINISSSTKPVLTATLTSINVNPLGIKVSGRYAYIAKETVSNIEIVDISIPSAPVSLGTFSTAGVLRNVDISGRYLYVADYGANKMDVIDIKGAEVGGLLAHSAEFGTSRTLGNSEVYGKLNVGDSLFVKGGSLLNTLNVSATSTFLGNVGIGNINSSLFKLQVTGDIGPSANNFYNLGSSSNRWKNTYVADVNSLPTGSTLSIVTSTATGGNGAHDIKIIGKYAYVANYTANNFSILDISNPTYTSTLGTVTLGTNPYALDIQGNYAYVVNRNSDTISVVDITNVNAPVVVATMQNGSGGAPANTFNDPEDVLANGNYLYIANWNNYKLVVMDISNPASPTYINGFTVLASYPPVSLAMRGNQLYVGLQGAISGGYFGILDISNPANPSNLKSVNIGGKPKGLDIQGNYAYVTENDTNQLSVINISSSTKPVLTATLTSINVNPLGIKVSGRYAYIAKETVSNIEIVDISIPSAPVSLGTFSTAGVLRNVDISGRYLYVADYGANKMDVIDIKGAEVGGLLAHSAEFGTSRTLGNSEVYGKLNVGDSLFVKGLSKLNNLKVDNYVWSNLSPILNNTYSLGDSTHRWQNIFSNTVSTTQLYINGTLITGATPTLQQVTNAGYITNRAIGIAGASSTGNVLPTANNAYDLGSSAYRWRDMFSSRNIYASGTVQGATMRSYGTLRADGAATFNGTIALGDATADTITATGYFGSNLIPSVNTTYTLGTSALRWKNLYATNVSSTNIDVSGYISSNTLISNSANLGNATTTNLYNSGTVSTTQLYVNGVAVTGASVTPSLQQVTDVGATTNKRIQFAGATSTANLLIKGSANVPQLVVQANGTQSLSNQLVQFKNSAGTVIGGMTANVVTNIFTGFNSGVSITSGINNSFYGNESGEFVTTGGQNTAVGSLAMYGNYNNITGSYNTAIGGESMYGYGGAAISGDANSALGFQSLTSLTSGYDNTGVGYYALRLNTTGYENTAIGSTALNSNTTGIKNVGIGFQTLYTNSTGTANVAVGNESLYNNDGSNNIAIGKNASFIGTFVDETIAIGTDALFGNSADGNMGIGFNAGRSNLTGTRITAIGHGAMENNSTGNDNIGIGYETSHNNVSGNNNTALGSYALYGNYNNSHSNNTAIGYHSLYVVTTASNNTALGSGALSLLSTGASNTAIGLNAGANLTTGTNNITIGSNVNAISATGNNQLNIGNTLYGTMNNGYVGIGDSSPAALLSVGSGDTFQVNTSGDLAKVNNVTYSWPASQGGVTTYLRNDGSGNLTWQSITAGVTGSGTDNRITRWNGTGAVQDSLIEISDAGHLLPSTTLTYDLGSSSNRWKDVWASSTRIGTSTWDIWQANQGLVISNNNLTNKYFNINNNGNVGIGDSTPAALFTVGNGDTFRVNTSGNLIRINNVPYSWPAANASGALRNDGSGNISFNNNVGQFTNDSGYITAVPGQTLTSAYFWVGNGSNQAAAVTMSGEGTLSNAGVLDVSGLDTADFTTANISQWTNNSGYITSANAFIQNGNSFTANASLGTNDAYNLALETSGVARMTILSTGNVGIGDATPAALLTVGNGDLFQVSSAGYVYAQNGSAGSPSYSFVNDPDTGMYDFSANTIGFGAGGNLISAMENGTTYIYGNGSVGAGVYFTDADRSNGVYLRAHSNFSPNYTITLPISAPGATAFMKSDSSGNLSWDTNSYITAGTAFIQDGNSFGGAATLGTNDSNVLNFETGGVAQMQLGTGGSLFLNGNSNAVQIAVKANASQTNVNPLIGLFNSGGSMIGSLHTDNASNIFVGLNTGRSNTVGGGLYNSFIGSSAGYSNTGGDGNTAIGYQTSYNNLLGSYNTAIGYQSMLGVLTNNNTGNTGIGSYSLLGITSGNYNTALGYYAAGANTSGAFNVALGPFALYQNTNSSNNVAVGSYSLFTSNGGTGNVAVGDSAARILSTGSYVTALGTWSLYNNTASYSTAVGFQALYTNTIGPNNTAVGYNALNQNSSGGQNTAMGYESLLNNGTSGLNTAIGYYALRGATAGNGNTAIGARAMDIATGSYNTAIGNDSIGAAYTGTYSIAIGGAMVNSTAGDYNIGIGHYALDSINNTGADYNIGIGDQALFGNLSGNNNIAIGNLAMQSNTANSYAVGIGFQSLLNSTANYNVAVGYRAGEVISTGIGNISIGPYSGYLLNETGNYNTYMGYNARGTGNYNYSMGLGYNAQPVASGYIHIGENSLTNIAWIGGVRTWSTYSDIRIKRDIVDSDLGLNFILKLRPVKYKAASSTDETLLDGFIADEVHTAMQELGVSFSGYKDPVDDGADPSALKSLGYDLFTVPLVNAVQELYASTTPLWNGIAIDSNFAALEEPFMQVDTDGNIAYKGVSITSKGIATSSTQAFDSYTFSYKGSAWNTDTAQEITTSFDVFNNTISATSSELKFIYTTGTGFTQNLLTITNSGDVHVSGDLHVGRRLYLGSNTSGEASTSTYIFVDDTLSPTSTYIATNADGWQTESTYDYAERYESSEDLIPGDLVTTDPSGVNLVKRATSPSEPLLGIVSTKPGFVTGRHYEGWYPIALAGRVPTRVSTINGAIKAGDYIAASDIPGVGIKATGAGNVIGVALESYDLTEEGLISVFVKPSFSMGSIYKTGASAGTINNYTTLLASTPRVEIEGLAMVLAGATEVHISYGSILHYSMVYATPHASIDGSWWVANRTDTGFDIMFSQPQTHDAEFTWLAKPMNPGTIRFVSNNTNQGVDDLTGQPIGPSLDDLLTTTSTDPATSDPEPATSSTTMVSSIDTTETDATASSTWPVTGGDAVTSPI